MRMTIQYMGGSTTSEVWPEVRGLTPAAVNSVCAKPGGRRKQHEGERREWRIEQVSSAVGW